MGRAVLLISHGELANTMKSTVELIAGEQQHLFALSMDLQASFDSYFKELEETVKQLLQDYDGELLILSDIKGGTPCNTATKLLLSNISFDLVTGFNLGMVIEASLTNVSVIELLRNTESSIAYINDSLVNK